MNKFERQGRPSADQPTLSESLAVEPTVVPSDIPDISDAPPIAPPAPLTSERSPHHLDEPDADDVSGRARPDHRCDGIADHRAAVRRRFQPVMGHYRLSAGVDRGGAGVRHAERHLWPPCHDHHLDEPVYRGLDPVRGRPQHAGSDHRTRPSGPGRRRHSADRSDRDCRRRDAARARPVPGLFQRRVDGGGNRRTDPRRRFCRTSPLVDDFLDQRAARPHIAGDAVAEDGPDPGFSPAPQSRLARRCSADGRRRRGDAGADLGRQPLSLAVAGHHGDGRRLDCADVCFRVARLAGRRAVPAAVTDGRNGRALRDGLRRLRAWARCWD